MFKAKNRQVEQELYFEKHHVVPKCLGGANTKDNIVQLTAEEHFVAHQLLVKIHPNVNALWSAAILMTAHRNGKRVNNKIYAWLKQGYAKTKRDLMLKTGGPTKDKKWIICLQTKETKLIDKLASIPLGWIVGKSLKKHSDKILQSIAKNAKREKEFDGKKLLAVKLHKAFIEGNFKSIRSFAKSECCKFSHVYVIKLWKECLPEISNQLQHGKSYTRINEKVALGL